MKRSIAAAAIAGTLLTGVGVGSTLLGPLSAIAETSSETTRHNKPGGPTGEPPWITEALGNLVEAKTINQAQADAVLEALKAARPEHRGPGSPGGPPFGIHRGGPDGPGGIGRLAMATTAKALGVSEEDLGAALRDGKTVAAVAKERNVEIATVVDALVAEASDRAEEAVPSGRLSQAQADEMTGKLKERITAHVNGEGPFRHPGPHRQ